jgi:hypothetical protein
MTAREAANQFGAQFYSPWPGDPTGSTPQMYYRWHAQMFNDRSIAHRLQYLSFCDLWQYSGEHDHETLARERLVPIQGATPHDREAEEARLIARREEIDAEIAAEDLARFKRTAKAS